LFQIPSTVVHSFEKRDYVIKELLETEKNYVDVLASLIKHFMKPLSNLLRKEDKEFIFGGIKVISSSHRNKLRKKQNVSLLSYVCFCKRLQLISMVELRGGSNM